jgi:hypothetical protein
MICYEPVKVLVHRFNDQTNGLLVEPHKRTELD